MEAPSVLIHLTTDAGTHPDGTLNPQTSGCIFRMMSDIDRVYSLGDAFVMDENGFATPKRPGDTRLVVGVAGDSHPCPYGDLFIFDEKGLVGHRGDQGSPGCPEGDLWVTDEAEASKFG